MNENKPLSRSRRLWQLFSTFFRIGLFTFGGGYAMIPLIQREAVEKQGWVTDDDILEIIAIAESTPGPIAINSATFVGYRAAGVAGSACATLGVVLPSFIIILILAGVLAQFQALAAVKYAFFGIRAGVLALVLKSWWTMFKKCKKNAVAYSAMAVAFVGSAILGLHVLLLIVGCAVLGLVVSLLRERGNHE